MAVTASTPDVADAARLRDRAWLLVLLAAAVLGVAYAVVVPAGLPYDEPSHWDTVLFYRDHWRLPVLGDPGVTYEAQMGPVAYVVAASFSWPFAQVSDVWAFYAVRLLGVGQLLLLGVLARRLLLRAVPGRPGPATAAAALVVLNPILLAIASSVQNDVLMLVLGVLLTVLALSGAPTPRRALVLGLVAGAALLTKITAWPFCLVVGLWLLWRRQWVAVLAYGSAAAVTAGWWFVRNLVLYGDVTGQSAVAATGATFETLPDFQVGAFLKGVVTYLWVPTEYVRNTVVAPTWVDATVAVATLLGLVGLAAIVVRRRALDGVTTGLLVGATVVAGSVWVLTYLTVQAVSLRFAYGGLMTWFLGFAVLATWRPGRVLVGVAFLAVAVLNAWFLLSVSGQASFLF